MSWAKEAAATIAPKSFGWYPKVDLNWGCFLVISLPANLPILLPTTETSRLWVNLVWTKSVFEKGITWVLSWRLLKEEEKTILS